MAYRRPKSLRDLLVHAKLKPDPKDNEPLGESKPCGRARCQTCKMILGTQTVKSSSGATAAPSNTETTVIPTRPLRSLKKELSWPRFMLDFSALPVG